MSRVVNNLNVKPFRKDYRAKLFIAADGLTRTELILCFLCVWEDNNNAAVMIMASIKKAHNFTKLFVYGIFGKIKSRVNTTYDYDTSFAMQR